MEIRQAVELACILEATARKAGNVHPDREFVGLTYLQLLASGLAIGPILARTADRGVGKTLVAAIHATRQVVDTNTNLGIVLLLTPLCAAIPRGHHQQTLERAAVARVLADLSVEDARLGYTAIRLAIAGGLGQVENQDVREEPTVTLRAAMALARDRDLIAKQYVDDFVDIFELGVPALSHVLDAGGSVEDAIIWCQLRFLATYPDSLLMRKRGHDDAQQARHRAQTMVERFMASGVKNIRHDPEYQTLDTWLRQFGHQRNPGTTADLVTASLFVLLTRDRLSPARFFTAFHPPASA